MIQPKKYIEKIGDLTVHAVQFGSRRIFDEWIKEQTPRLNSHNKAKMGEIQNSIRSNYKSDWYGSPAAKSADEIFNHDKYLAMDTYKEIRQEMRKALSKAEKLSQISPVVKRKLQYNDMGLGVFVFDRAAMMLRHQPTDDGLTRRIKRDINKMNIELGSQERLSDPTTIVSDVTKVYAYHPPSDQSRDVVKLYIISGGTANITGEQMIYTGIGATMISEYLVEAGYDVEINVIVESQNQKGVYSSFFKLKSTNTDININDTLLLTADPRWFRSKGFEAIISQYDFFSKNVPSSLGTQSSKTIWEAFLSKIDKDSGMPILLNPSYSKEAVIKEVNRVLSAVNKKQLNRYAEENN